MNEALRALVHHIEIDRHGWVGEIVAAWVENAFYYQTGYQFTSIDEIESFIAKEFKRSFHRLELQEVIDSLSNNSLVKTDKGWKLSEQRIADLDAQILEFERLENTVQEEWRVELASKYSWLSRDKLDHLWNVLINGFIGRVFLKHGADTFSLITGTELVSEENVAESYSTLIQESTLMLEDARLEQLAATEFPLFFDSTGKPGRRKYLIGHIGYVLAHFAVGFDQQMIDTIYTQPVDFVLFLDTNFLYSILGIHDNPLNEAAKAVYEATRNYKGKAKVELLFTEETLAEFNRGIEWAISILKGYTWTKELSSVATRSGSLQGLISAYHKANAEKRTDPEAFFGKYRSSLHILKSMGIDIWPERLDYLKTNRPVTDDIMEEFDYYQDTARKPKKYETLEHDVLMWHLVKNKRPPGDSVAQAKYFILTCDYRFCSFDKRRRQEAGLRTPICLLPSQLFQILRLFVPRTENFDTAFLQSFRLPITTPFDVKRENLVMRILQVLSQMSSLPEEAARSILTDDVILAKLEKVVDNQIEFVKVVNDELGEKIALLEKETVEKQRKIDALKKEGEEVRKTYENELSEHARRLKEIENKYEERLRDQAKQAEDLKRKLAEFEEQKRLASIKKSALLRLAITASTFLVLEGLVILLSWIYGEGLNLYQKIANSWPYLTGGAFVTLFIGRSIVGRSRLEALGWPFLKILKR